MFFKHELRENARGWKLDTILLFVRAVFEMWEVLNLLEVIQESNKNFSYEEVPRQRDFFTFGSIAR